MIIQCTIMSCIIIIIIMITSEMLSIVGLTRGHACAVAVDGRKRHNVIILL